MNGASKILTVSYGTFSCTLEGFDDPFNTMKAIAEYFRDLAAGDRYFGAEPPTPDAAMLHRIAEREVQRRVEARIEDNNVILRAGDGPVAEPAAAVLAPAAAELPVQPVSAAAAEPELLSAGPELAPVAEAVVEAVVETVVAEPVEDFPDVVAEAVEEAVAQPEPVAELAAAPEAEAAPAFEEPPEAPAAEKAEVEVAAAEEPPEEDIAQRPSLAPAMPEGVVAKLARLRRAVASNDAATLAPAAALPEHFEDEHAVEVTEFADLTEAFAVSDEVADDPAAGPVDEPAVAAEAVTEEAATEAAPVETNGDAEVLARLGGLLVDEGEVQAATGVADENEALPAAAEPMAEAAKAAVAEEDGLAGLIASLSGGAEAAAEVAEETPAAADPFADEMELEDEEVFALAEAPEVPELAELSGDLNDDLPEGLLDAWDEEPALPEELAAALDPLPEDLADEVEDQLLQETAAEAAAEAPAEAVEGAASEPVAAEPDVPEVEAPEPAEAAALDTAEPSDKLQRARARVIKIRRIAPEAQTAAPDEAPEAPVVPEAEAPAAAAPEARPRDDDMVRLLRQADDEMSEPENRRRLAAIQHLKAAVAATVAERRAGVVEPSDDDRADPYRADLARVVRPVRPRSAEGERQHRPAGAAAAFGTEGSGPSADRPAPLVLVSEQRIDRSAPQGMVTPVRPRRVVGGAATAVAPGAYDMGAETAPQPVAQEEEAEFSAADTAEIAADTAMIATLDNDSGDDAEDAGNIFDDSRGFADFAERLGANGLSQMLEAAAAYATCFENREQFTRPFLMRQVEAGKLGAGFTREDGLRGFGTLLREGRISKVGRGHFVLADNSSYLAEARKLAR